MRNTTNNVVQPYLFFGGRCEEALKFYQQALGASVNMTMRFSECPDCGEVPEHWADKIMHADLQIGETTIMASDGCWQQQHSGFHGFALSFSASDEAEAQRRFATLAEGGEVRMPLEKTFFATVFGMVTDKFGVAWMIIVPAEQPTSNRRMETAVA